MDETRGHNVLDYGAVGGDDTDFVQAAFDAGKQLAPGTYRISRPVTYRGGPGVGDGVHLVGCHAPELERAADHVSTAD